MVTTMTKRNPFLGFGFDKAFDREIERMFENDLIFKHLGNRSSPRINFKENDESYIAELEVPGVSKDDLKISLDENLITVNYEENSKSEKGTDKYSKMEFYKKSFEKSFSLPKDTDLDSITSKCENGILYINVPKSDLSKKRSRVIDIN